MKFILTPLFNAFFQFWNQLHRQISSVIARVFPDGSNACLRSKENVENDTNRQIFETMSKENSVPFDIFIWKEFNELLLLIFYWLPNDLCTGGRNNTFCLPLISLSILHKISGEEEDLT